MFVTHYKRSNLVTFKRSFHYCIHGPGTKNREWERRSKRVILLASDSLPLPSLSPPTWSLPASPSLLMHACKWPCQYDLPLSPSLFPLLKLHGSGLPPPPLLPPFPGPTSQPATVMQSHACVVERACWASDRATVFAWYAGNGWHGIRSNARLLSLFIIWSGKGGVLFKFGSDKFKFLFHIL